MGKLVRGWAWEKTGLGPIDGWPPVLLTVVNVALNSDVASAVYWGPELLMVYNDGYRDNIGARHPAALGASARAVWADLWEQFGEEFEGVLRDGNSVVHEKVLVMLPVEGRVYETFWNLSLNPVYEDGRIAGILKMARNITDEVNAMNALAMSDERLRLALSARNCLGTWDWQIGGDRIFAEGRLARVYGLDAQVLRNGVSRAEFLRNVHEDDRPKVLEAGARAIRTGEEYRMEYRVRQVDGSVRWVSSKGSCVYGDDGTPTRFPGITYDITAERVGAWGDTDGDAPKIVLRPAGAEPDAEPVVSLVEFIVVGLARCKEEVVVTSFDDGDETHVTVRVAGEDIERVVGEDGRTAASLRSVVGAAGLKSGRRYAMEIVGEAFEGEFGVGWVQ
jgi:PAS domain S-box-containing protein